ncbi:GGDEF domain-containing protein [Rhodococcoides fascians]|uniref:GGDEF domain-containing protein n=1 Tax=Rhodococcoides fascians TaxID=1828 RepID=UPI0037B708FC
MSRFRFDESGRMLAVFAAVTTVLYIANGIASWSDLSGPQQLFAALAVVLGPAAIVVLARAGAPSPKHAVGTATALSVVALACALGSSNTMPAFLICVQAAMFLGMHIGAFWSERDAGIWVAVLAVSAVVGAAVAPYGTPFISYILVALGIVGATEVFGVFARRMRYSATHDALTGLLNRFGFESKIEKMLPACAARGLTVSLAVLDLDNFKEINDEYGHIAGDVLLTRVSKAWKGQLTKRDVLGRLGGDEFVLFMPGVLEAEAWQVIDGLRRSHRAEWSVGLACMPAGRRWGEIYRAADADLYRAKRSRPPKASRHTEPGDGHRGPVRRIV